jgi:general secretion pathway protein D
MTSRLVRACLAVVLSVLLPNLRAQAPGGPLPTNPPPAAPARPAATPTVTPAPGAASAAVPSTASAVIPGLLNPDEPVSLNLPEGDIDAVITALEMFTGRMALRPAALPTATYHIPIKQQIPKADAIVAIETVLALNQVAVVPLGDKFLKIIPLNQGRQEAPEMINGSTLDQPASGKVATKVFQLEFMRVNPDFIQMTQGILNPFFGGPVQIQGSNAAIVTDSVSNLQRVELLLQQLDKPNPSGMKPKFYPLTNASAVGVVNKMRQILIGPLQQQLGTTTNYIADERTNQIIVFTDPRQYPFFDDLIEKLDVNANQNTKVDVIYLNHAKAADVVQVLQHLITGQTAVAQRQNQQSVRPGQPLALPQPNQPTLPGAAPAAPVSATNLSGGDALGGMGNNEFSQLMTVVNDDRSNAIVVSGTADDVRLLRELTNKLDIVLAQVRIECVIAEVTLDDQHVSGISALGLKIDGDKLVGFSGSANGSSIAITNGTITRPGGTGIISGPWDLAAEIALGTTPRATNSTILSVPAITTSHGKKAKFFDGETRPVVTGVVSAAGATTTGLSTSSTVTQQQIGTTLTVTPFIGTDGTVNLDVVQDVQDVTGTVQVDQNTQYIIGDRSTDSNITAKSGDIIVLGGFRKSIDLKSTNRLGPIPIIGDLLGARNREKKHIELIFFLRPVVLTNSPQIDNAEAYKRIEVSPNREEIRSQLDPNYVPPKKSILDKILPK